MAVITLGAGIFAVLAARTFVIPEAREKVPDAFPAGVPQEYLASPTPTDPVTVSMVALLARPRDFDGQHIRVVGFGHLEFEGDTLYLHQEDFERALATNSVHLDVEHRPAFMALNNRYVIVEGAFEAAPESSIRLRPGTIRRISRYDPMPSYRELAERAGRLPAK
jgi:hypothetical protein